MSEQAALTRTSAYVDSGVLIKLYVREPNSAAAAQLVTAFPSVKLYPFQELEVRNTLRALAGRTIITAAQRAVAEHEFERDLILGRLRRAVPDWRQVFQVALRLSMDHTAATLARSLDILHVAIAIAEQADPFITADRRQLEVARREVLRCMPKAEVRSRIDGTECGTAVFRSERVPGAERGNGGTEAG